MQLPGGPRAVSHIVAFGPPYKPVHVSWRVSWCNNALCGPWPQGQSLWNRRSDNVAEESQSRGDEIFLPNCVTVNCFCKRESNVQ